MPYPAGNSGRAKWKHPCATAALFAWLFLLACVAQTQTPTANGASADSDHDGLNDALEAGLLAKFLPVFINSNRDCSTGPAQFLAHAEAPTVLADDGTIYGQAFPSRAHWGEVELHYYHLWRKDCGEMGIAWTQNMCPSS